MWTKEPRCMVNIWCLARFRSTLYHMRVGYRSFGFCFFLGMCLIPGKTFDTTKRGRIRGLRKHGKITRVIITTRSGRQGDWQ